MEFVNNINVLTTAEIIKIYIDDFNASKQRKLMIKGDNYYKVENDILNRKMTRYEDELPVDDETKTNNKLAHGYMHNLVDDKVNYLLVKPYTMSCDDEVYLKVVEDTLGKRFQKKLGQLGTETSNKGIAWLHTYVDSNGLFKTLKIPTEQVVPLWLDNDHEELQALIRFYDIEVYEGKTKKYITKIEYWTAANVEYYVKDSNDEVIVDAEMYLDDDSSYDGHFKVSNEAGSWDRVPFIPFKNNDFELPDLQFVKTLVDNYDLTRSDNANLLEDVKNAIMKLKGYGGQDLSQFMRDLSYYRAILLDDDGDADTMSPEVNIDAAEKHYNSLRKDIYNFGQSVDKSSDSIGNSPSGIALRFMYSGLDLKCNAMEDGFKWAFEELLYFVNTFLTITKQHVSDKEIEIIFNRDMILNEDSAITNCQNSLGVISRKTIVANHPFVTDLDAELAQIKEEEESTEIAMLGEDTGTNNG